MTAIMTALQSYSGGSNSEPSAFLCNVYKVLFKTLCLLSITKLPSFVYTSITSVW